MLHFFDLADVRLDRSKKSANSEARRNPVRWPSSEPIRYGRCSGLVLQHIEIARSQGSVVEASRDEEAARYAASKLLETFSRDSSASWLSL